MDSPRAIRNGKRKSAFLSASTQAWNDAALNAGNKADKDPEFAKKVGAQLY